MRIERGAASSRGHRHSGKAKSVNGPGFPTVLTFNKQFKKVTGYTPHTIGTYIIFVACRWRVSFGGSEIEVEDAGAVVKTALPWTYGAVCRIYI